MKSTVKYVEIMEKLTGISVGSQVTFEESTYEVAGINTDEIEAKVTLTSEGKDDIELTLKNLIESEEYSLVEKKACEEEGEDDKEMDDKEGEEEDDKEKQMGEEEGEEDDKEGEEGEEDDKEMEEKKKAKK